MHEYSLASAVIAQVQEIAIENKATRVKKIRMSASPYEMIIPDLLSEAYQIIIVENDLFKDSTLELVFQKSNVTCLKCEYDGAPDEEGDPEFAYNFKCPKCGSRDTHLNIQGMIIESVDLEIPSEKTT